MSEGCGACEHAREVAPQLRRGDVGTYQRVGRDGLVELTGCLAHEQQLKGMLADWRLIRNLLLFSVPDAQLGRQVRAIMTETYLRRLEEP